MRLNLLFFYLDSLRTYLYTLYCAFTFLIASTFRSFPSEDIHGFLHLIIANVLEEERMLHYLFSKRALLGVELQHPLHDLNGVLACIRNQTLQVLLLVVREENATTLSEPLHVWPVLRGRRAENLDDFVELVELAGAWEERLHHVELCHNATQSEDVHWIIVAPRSKNALWRPVPPCRYVFCERRRAFDLSNKPEVRDLDRGPVLDQQIVGFQVSVKKPVLMHVSQALHHLEHYQTHLVIVERLILVSPAFDELVQIHVEQLEHHIERIIVPDDFLKLDNIRVLQLNQSLNFRVADCFLPTLVLAFELLHCEDVASFSVLDFEDIAEGTVT